MAEYSQRLLHSPHPSFTQENHMEDVVIVAAARTAVGKFGGSLANVPAPELGATVIKALLERSGLQPDLIDEVLLGQVLTAAENVARKYDISRAQQDEFAAASQQKAEAAQKAGKFRDEIVPVSIVSRKGTLVFDSDEFIKHGTTVESLGSLRPAFDKTGTV